MKIVSKLAAVAASSAALVMVTPSTSQADTWMLFVNYNSGRCLEIADSSSANGARAQQWSCNGQDAARWRMSWVNSERVYFKLVNKATGKCLEIENSSKANGARAQQWACKSGVQGQIWGRGSNGRLVNAASGKDLEIENSSKANGARAQQWGEWGSSGGTTKWARIAAGN
ncbi:RICIN domain-containing protein [Streptomyces lasiicapitis]|uniref:RICIN domain-containing protein n=1 Tax=Streptomyces lasiicapitis TaxID=1923961 RepID=UPI00365D4D71